MLAVMNRWDLAALGVGPLSYAIGAAPAALVWREHLPAGASQAMGQLHAERVQLAGVDQALAEALPRIENLVGGRTGATSYDLGDALLLPQAEAELLRWLRTSPWNAGPVSYELPGWLVSPWSATVKQLQDAVERARQFVANDCWIETDIAGRVVGRTHVGRLGNLNTAWQLAVGPAQRAMHKQAVAQALTSSRAWVRTIGIVTRGALRLVVLPALLSNPVGGVIALVGMWNFVNQIIDELSTPVART